MTSSPPGGPDPRVVLALDAALDLLDRRTARVLLRADGGLPVGLYRMAEALRGTRPRVGELAVALGVHVSTASKGVDALCRDGVAVRVVDGLDSRGVRVQLTTFGRGVLEAATSARERNLSDALVRWTEKDRRTLVEHLRSFVATSSATAPGAVTGGDPACEQDGSDDPRVQAGWG